MSKSADSAYNYIALTDSPDEIRRKIRRAVTDSGAEVRVGPDKPALTNLLTIYSLLAGESVEALVERYEGRGYADFKADLAEVVVEALAPVPAAHDRARRRQGLHPRRAARRRRARRGHRRAHHARRCATAWGSSPGRSVRAPGPAPQAARRRPASQPPSAGAPPGPGAASPGPAGRRGPAAKRHGV